jgi:hypothetical protein
LGWLETNDVFNTRRDEFCGPGVGVQFDSESPIALCVLAWISTPLCSLVSSIYTPTNDPLSFPGNQ